jgi:hypothetical protein
MANYILRIELLGSPGEETYKTLQAFMAGQGFSMSISNGAGEPAVLPHATYLGESSLAPPDAAYRLRSALQDEVWPSVKVLAMIYSAAALAG